MTLFLPMNSRRLAKFANEVIRAWDASTEEQRAAGGLIDPNEPVVLRVKARDIDDGCFLDEDGDDDEFNGNVFLHLQSLGGGYDETEAGEPCGHQGIELSGMEIDQQHFLYNGRRFNSEPA